MDEVYFLHFSLSFEFWNSKFQIFFKEEMSSFFAFFAYSLNTTNFVTIEKNIRNEYLRIFTKLYELFSLNCYEICSIVEMVIVEKSPSYLGFLG